MCITQLLNSLLCLCLNIYAWLFTKSASAMKLRYIKADIDFLNV